MLLAKIEKHRILTYSFRNSKLFITHVTHVCLHVSIEPLLCHACKRKVFADLDGMRNQPFWIIPLIDEGKIESTSKNSKSKYRKYIYPTDHFFSFVTLKGNCETRQKFKAKRREYIRKIPPDSWKLKYHIRDQCFRELIKLLVIFSPQFCFPSRFFLLMEILIPWE